MEGILTLYRLNGSVIAKGRVHENKKLRRMFGPKRGETVRVGGNSLMQKNNGKFYGFYSSLNIWRDQGE